MNSMPERLSMDRSQPSRARPRVLGDSLRPVDRAVDSQRGQGLSWEVLAQQLLAWVGSWAWRNRREIGPGGAALAVFVIGTWGHFASPAWGWAAAPGGLLLTLAGWGLALRWRHGQVAWAVGVAGSLWATALWLLGPLHPAVLLGLVAVLAPSWALWLRYVHPRPRVHVVGGSRLPWRWEAYCFRRGVRQHLAKVIREWPDTASNASVPGSRIRLAEGDRVSYRLHIDLRPGQTMEDLVAARGRVESALGSKRNRVRIASDGFADRIVLTWALGDPLSGISKWEGPRTETITEPIPIATYQDGQPLAVRFSAGVHWLVTGQTGMGKSSLMDLLVGSFAACRDAVIWACDPENGVSLGKWERVLDWLSDEDTAETMLKAVMAVHEARLEVLRAAGVSDWTADLGPFLVVILDEFPVLSTRAKALASEAAKRTRKTGVRLIVLAQVSSAEEVGSTVLRGNLRGVISFALQEVKHADFAFAGGLRAAGWDPLKLDRPGDVLVRSPEHRDAVPARTFLVEPDEAQEWAARLGRSDRPVIDRPAERPRLAVVPDADDVAELDDVVADDDEADDGPVEVASREERILEVLRAAGEPVAGREVARRAGLPHAKVASTDLPELERRGLVAYELVGSAKMWRLVEACSEDRL